MHRRRSSLLSSLSSSSLSSCHTESGIGRHEYIINVVRQIKYTRTRKPVASPLCHDLFYFIFSPFSFYKLNVSPGVEEHASVYVSYSNNYTGEGGVNFLSIYVYCIYVYIYTRISAETKGYVRKWVFIFYKLLKLSRYFIIIIFQSRSRRRRCVCVCKTSRRFIHAHAYEYTHTTVSPKNYIYTYICVYETENDNTHTHATTV